MTLTKLTTSKLRLPRPGILLTANSLKNKFTSRDTVSLPAELASMVLDAPTAPIIFSTWNNMSV